MLSIVRIFLLAAAAVFPLLADPGADFFEAKVRPLLAAKCYACHSAKSAAPMAGLRFDDPAIAHKSAAKILPAVRYESIGMPPTGKLKPDEIATLEKWAEMGAPRPPPPPHPAPPLPLPGGPW
jgi:uncharacterized membrane protein